MTFATQINSGESFAEILSGAKRGANWAWAAIYRELAGSVTGYLTSRGAADPEDICSETFLQVARGIGRFTGDWESFRSWVFVIAHRRLQDSRRARDRRPVTYPLDRVFFDEADPSRVDDQAITALSTQAIWEMFEKLTDNQREVLALRIIADLSVAESASVMGKRPGAVKALQRRALASVRAELERRAVTQ